MHSWQYCHLSNLFSNINIVHSAKVNVDHQNYKGQSLLHYCAISGDLAMTEFMISIHSPGLLTDKQGKSCLHTCLENGHFHLIDALTKVVNVNAADINGFTALHLCSDNSQVDLLLERGANPNIKGRLSAPFLYHLENGHVIAIHFLKLGLESGMVDLNVTNDIGRNFLHICAHLGLIEPLSLFVEHFNMSKHADIVNCLTSRQNSIIHAASTQENIEIVRLILLLGVDPFIRNNLGYTAAQTSASEEIRDLIENYTVTFNASPNSPVAKVVRCVFDESNNLVFMIKFCYIDSFGRGDITTTWRCRNDFAYLRDLILMELPFICIPDIQELFIYSDKRIQDMENNVQLVFLRKMCEKFEKYLFFYTHHPTISHHELLIEFFHVEDIDWETAKARSQAKAEYLAEKFPEVGKTSPNIQELTILWRKADLDLDNIVSIIRASSVVMRKFKSNNKRIRS